MTWSDKIRPKEHAPIYSLAVVWYQPSCEKEKKSAWQTWWFLGFIKLGHYPLEIDKDDLKILKSIITMYDHNSSSAGVDDAQFDMFSRKQKPFVSLDSSHSACAVCCLPERLHMESVNILPTRLRYQKSS